MRKPFCKPAHRNFEFEHDKHIRDVCVRKSTWVGSIGDGDGRPSKCAMLALDILLQQPPESFEVHEPFFRHERCSFCVGAARLDNRIVDIKQCTCLYNKT